MSLNSKVVIVHDAAGNEVTLKPASTAAIATDAALVVAVSPNNTIPVSGTFFQATQPVSVSSLPLPTGAATQVTLASILTNTPSAGQAVMAASTPVVIASNQSTISVTGPLTDTQLRAVAVPVSGTFFQATQPVSIAATLAVSGPLTDTQLRAVAVPVSGTFFQATQPVSGTVAVSNFPATQSVSGTVTANQGGTWTVQPGNTANTTAWKVDGSAVTQPISAASLPLPTGAATETTLSTRLADATFTGRINTLGQKAMAASTPVVLASDQSSVIVTMPTDRSGSGSIAALNALIAANTTGASTVTFSILGTFVATIGVEGTVDGTNWYPITGTIIGQQNEFVVAYTSTPSIWSVPCGGFSQVRLHCVLYTSGTATVTWNAGAGQLGSQVHNYDIASLRSSVRGQDIQNLGTLTGAGQTTVTSVVGLSTITISVFNVWVATLVFEANVDGTLWFPVNAYTQGSGAVVSSVTANGNYTVPCGSFQQVRVRVNAFTSGSIGIVVNVGLGTNATPVFATALPLPTGAATETTLASINTKTPALGQAVMASSVPVVIASNQSILSIQGTVADGAAISGNPVLIAGYDGINTQILLTDIIGRQIISTVDGQKTTYSASVVGLVTAATPTDVFTISGSGTKTIRVNRIAITGSQTLAAQRDIQIIKRSAANTGGTSAAATKVPHDSANAAATATVLSYTVNPTGLGATVGIIRTRKVLVSTTAGNSDEFILDFGTRNNQSVVLRGTAELLTINLNSVTSAGNSFDISIEWTEE